MPTPIADQVASLEHDHSDALAKIVALTDALNAITAEKAALEAKVAELGTMVENVANSALNMLKAVKSPPGVAVAEVNPRAPKGSTPLTGSARLFVDAAGAAVKDNAALIDSLNAAQNVRVRDVLITDEMLKPEAAQQAGAEVLANNSVAQPSAGASDIAPSDESEAEQQRLQAIAAQMMPPAAWIAEPLSAVDAIKRRCLPFPALMRRPVDRNMDVAPNVGALPMFLQRDAVFARSGSQPLREAFRS
jgi:hypothetical protein